MARRRDEITDLALKGSKMVAKVLGLKMPVAGALAILIEAIGDRRAKRQFQRLEKLVGSLVPRLERLEGGIQPPPEPDLLDEILAKAVNDEDEDKTQYYAALVEYCVSGNRNAYQVRLLGDAIKGLTAHEIKAFAHFSKHGALRHDIPDDLRDIFWDRVCNFGLHQRGKVHHAEYTTSLGKEFLEVCELAISPHAKHG